MSYHKIRIVPVSFRAREIFIAPFGAEDRYIFSRKAGQLEKSGYSGIRKITLIPTRKIK